MNNLEKILLLVLGLAVIVLAVVLLLQPKTTSQTVVGEFTPPPFEEMAVVGTPTVYYPQIYGTLNLSEHASVSLYSVPVVQDNTATVFFAVKEESSVWVRLRLCDEEGNILGQTGLLRPGEYVKDILLERMPTSTRAVAKLLTYEPETYFSMGSATAKIQLQLK